MKKRLLIIDDEEGMCSGLKDILEDYYDIVVTGRIEEAWERIFSGECIDLIITDIVLPETDGLDFLKRLRKINPYIPAIVMTGSLDYEHAFNEACLNYCCCILKPFNIDLLLEKIREIVMDCNACKVSADRLPCLLQR